MNKLLSIIAAIAIVFSTSAQTTDNGLNASLNRAFEVHGTPGIEAYAQALATQLSLDLDGATYDTRHGFVQAAVNGDDDNEVLMRVWHRTDGIQLLLVSCRLANDVACKAYVYSEATTSLEPLEQLPVTGMPASGVYFLDLPKAGNDIDLRLAGSDDDAGYKLEWNGSSFNCVEARGVGVIVTGDTPLFKTPGGKAVATLTQGAVVYINRYERGFFHLSGNDYSQAGETVAFKQNGEKWVPRSSVTATWHSDATIELHEQPSARSRVLYHSDYSPQNSAIVIKKLLDISGKWVKVRLAGGSEGWVEKDLLSAAM